MRNVTIQRRKRFVASMGKMKVYLEDPMQPELEINGVPCRKLGELKNGEQQTFQIGEAPAKLFVIAGKASKSYCNDYVQLPQGTGDLFYSGQNEMDPSTGNAFRFDSNDPETVQNRKKGKKKGLWVSIIAIALGVLVGLLVPKLIQKQEESTPKTFTSHGVSMTLTEAFKESAYMGYTFSYETDQVVVMALREDFGVTDDFGELSVEEYGELVLEANGKSGLSIQKKDGLTFFEYDHTDLETKMGYHYYAYLFKADDAFWMIQFMTFDKSVEKYESKILEWAKSIQFEE